MAHAFIKRRIRRNCEVCGKEFLARIHNSKYCSKECLWSAKHEQTKHKDLNKWSKNIWVSAINKKFGASEEDYNSLFLKQKGNCAICGKHQSCLKRRLAIDHNHESGIIRGLLCGNCNTGIGNLRDSVELLEKAIIYLRAK